MKSTLFSLRVPLILAGLLTGVCWTSLWQDLHNSRQGPSSITMKTHTPQIDATQLLSSENIKLSWSKTQNDLDRSASHMDALHDKANIHHGPINFMHDPRTFVETIRACETDSRCRLILHHVGKTGGSTIESRFDSLWNDKQHLRSCCGHRMVDRVLANPEVFCAPKFSSYQVVADDFFRILDICVNHYPESQGLPKPRVVLLTTFREPIQLITSWIHQRCNKLRDKRSPLILEACQACRYENHTHVWDEMVNRTSQFLEHAWQVSRLVLDNQLLRSPLPSDTTVMALETNDITDFFTAYNDQNEMRPSNTEKLDHCNFHVPSVMMKGLREGEYYYRQLVANKDYE